MKFEVSFKNLISNLETDNAITKAKKRLLRVLEGFDHEDQTGFITLEKKDKPERFFIHINLKVPGRMIAAQDFGFTIDEALHKASADARDQLVKWKDRLKDDHEKLRRAKIKKLTMEE